jgi:hypothetical protein
LDGFLGPPKKEKKKNPTEKTGEMSGIFHLSFFRNAHDAAPPLSTPSPFPPTQSQGDATYIIVKPDGSIADFGLNAVCTHLGCVVPWNAAENKFKCPCHGSQYNDEVGTAVYKQLHPVDTHKPAGAGFEPATSLSQATYVRYATKLLVSQPLKKETCEKLEKKNLVSKRLLSNMGLTTCAALRFGQGDPRWGSAR